MIFDWCLNFGRVPMFFYILHIYMISISSRFVSYFMGNGSQLKHGIGLELEYVWLVSGFVYSFLRLFANGMEIINVNTIIGG